MSTKVLVENAKARFNHNESRLYLIEKYKNKLTLSHGGGMWNITAEFLGYLASSKKDELILLDSFSNPIKVNRLDFLTEMTEKYEYLMEEWYKEYTELSTQR
jgi:hypothetical protein